MSWGDTIDVPDTDEWHDANTAPDPRFDVCTVTGYGLVTAAPSKPWPLRSRSVSAHVIDRVFNSRVVATYRSDHLQGSPKHRRAQALAKAREHARILNSFGA